MSNLGSPARAHFTHQFLGSVIFKNLIDELDLDDFIPVHEANLDDNDSASLAPDVTVFNADQQPIVAFELSRTQMEEKDCKKAIRMLEEYPFLKEVFVFTFSGEYPKEKIHNIRKFTQKGEDKKNADYSDVLDIDVDEDLAKL
jgi:hypothetical protein